MAMTATRAPLRRGVLLVVLALAVAGCGKEQQPPPAPPSIGSYVAMGDSYSAGPEISPIADAACYRSGANYASLVEQDVTVSGFEDVTCGGATNDDLVESQTHNGETINAPQLDAVNSGTDLVTIGIGLNDSGLSIQLLYVCLPQLNLAKECTQYLHTPDSAIDQALDHVVAQTKASLQAIRKRAPRATVVLVGYPRMLPDKGSCPDALALSGKSATRLKHTLKTVNDDYRRIAAETGVKYVDTYTASAGHDVCSDSPWVNGAHDGGANGAPLHPTPAYQRAVADRIEALLPK
jgi:lysophospholipase L1-like esterase